MGEKSRNNPYAAAKSHSRIQARTRQTSVIVAYELLLSFPAARSRRRVTAAPGFCGEILLPRPDCCRCSWRAETWRRVSLPLPNRFLSHRRIIAATDECYCRVRIPWWNFSAASGFLPVPCRRDPAKYTLPHRELFQGRVRIIAAVPCRGEAGRTVTLQCPD